MKLETKDYIVSKSEMVSTLSPFKQKLCKWFRIEERKGSIFTVTLVVNNFPVGLKKDSLKLVDNYKTDWRILDSSRLKNTIKIQNTKPIYGLNKKVMNSLTLRAL